MTTSQAWTGADPGLMRAIERLPAISSDWLLVPGDVDILDCARCQLCNRAQ